MNQKSHWRSKMAKILIVNDTPHLLQLMKQHLRKEKYFQIIEAYDGKMALQKVEAEKPDLVVLDIVMPEMDGFEVCRMIRNSEKTRELPVIFFSAIRIEASDIIKGLDGGGDAYITDIFKPEQLLAQVRSLLRRMGQSKKLREENKQLKTDLEKKQKKIDYVCTKIEKERQETQQKLRQFASKLSKQNRTELSEAISIAQNYFRQVPDLLNQLEPRRKRILVTDDENMIRHMLEIKLKKMGYEVFQAEDGTSALKILQEKPVDLVICDAMMPDLDGFGLTRFIKEELGEDIPIIMITAKFTDSVLEQERKRWKFDAFFTKPFNLIEVAKKIETLLEAKEKTFRS